MLMLRVTNSAIGVSDSAITAGEYESYVGDVLAYVRDDDAAGLADEIACVEQPDVDVKFQRGSFKFSGMSIGPLAAVDAKKRLLEWFKQNGVA